MLVFLSEGAALHLSEYLVSEGISPTTFAERLGVSIYAVKKWRLKTRIPRPDHVIRIEAMTKGKVAPDDWYKRQNQRSSRGRIRV